MLCAEIFAFLKNVNFNANPHHPDVGFIFIIPIIWSP
jgi:hypothetical protein